MSHTNFLVRRCLAIFALLVYLLSGPACAFLGPSGTQPGPASGLLPAATPLPPPPETLVNFHVQVPENTPAEQTVYLTLLDEVTGLALNARHYAMLPDPASPGSYTLSLPFLIGSMVQYRYERQPARQAAAPTVMEHSSDGRAVRYRLLHVDGPGNVWDIISRWTDTPYTWLNGRITGQAVDKITGQPIPDLLIAAGGRQTLTRADGWFTLEGLPPGVHNLVAFAMDGAYVTYQQGAQVAPDSTTPAPLLLDESSWVNVVFVASLPPDTPPIVPVRLAGSLAQLGNTFANLSGGVSELTSRMPVLSALPDGRYSLTLSLPVGADIRYKYTLGDGFWNAEHAANGDFQLRQLIVKPDQGIVQDSVKSWKTGKNASLTVDLTALQAVNPEDQVYLQINPSFGWMEPLPMWPIGNNRWAYILFGPLDQTDQVLYRYCRNAQCDSLAQVQTDSGSTVIEQTVKTNSKAQELHDSVAAWTQFAQPVERAVFATATINPHGQTFIAGIETSTGYHPSWLARLPVGLDDVQNLRANWMLVTPTWTYQRQAPPDFEPVPGSDPTWPELLQNVQLSRERGLQVALFPTPRFAINIDQWWQTAPRDQVWWERWFETYRAFILHHASLATHSGAQALVLGGEWIKPALPGGILSDGSPSGVPADAEIRWRSLLAEVRNYFSGTILWAMDYKDIQNPPAFVDSVDQLYLLISAPLATAAGADQASLDLEATRILDEEIWPSQIMLEKPVILGLYYPSAAGSLSGCIPDGQSNCVDPQRLAPPNLDIPAVQLDLQAQVSAYSAFLTTVNDRSWVSGLVSRGYYPPAVLLDKSASLHGKPASEVLRYWFAELLGTPLSQAIDF